MDAARELYEQARLDDEVREEIGDPLVLEWQFLLLVNTLLKHPHPRKITWYVDERGGSGKTFICKWFEAYTNCVKFERVRVSSILRDADIKVKRPGVIILQKAPADHHEASSSHVASDEEYKEAAMDDEEAAVQEVRPGLTFSAGPSVVVAFQYQGEPVVFFDVVRTTQERFNYDVSRRSRTFLFCFSAQVRVVPQAVPAAPRGGLFQLGARQDDAEPRPLGRDHDGPRGRGKVYGDAVLGNPGGLY